MNIVLDDAVEEKDGGEKVRIGTVVIRGNSVVMLEVRLRGLSPVAGARFLMLCGVGFGEDKLESGGGGCYLEGGVVGVRGETVLYPIHKRKSEKYCTEWTWTVQFGSIRPWNGVICFFYSLEVV